MIKLSDRCSLLEPSATLAINALAKERAAAGLKVINLSTGEPDFPTPLNVCEAAKKAIDNGQTKYTAVGGTAELKKAISAKFKRDLGVDFSVKQITCSNGGKQILYNLFQVILNPGDEVLCFSPYWLSYKSQVELAGGKLVEVGLDVEKSFAFDAELLGEHLSDRTVAIILNSPANPTGQVLDDFSLALLAEIAKFKDILVISDDVYEQFYYDSEMPKHILQMDSELVERTVIVNAVSKTYAMTGWRLGYAAGPEKIIQKMEELQSHSSSNPSSISQAAALEALSGPQGSVEEMRMAFQGRKKFILAELEGLNFIEPRGAFYFMLDIRGKKLSGESDLDFCLDLLGKTGVAVVPGESFGKASQGFVRISFATALDEVINGIREIKRFRST